MVMQHLLMNNKIINIPFIYICILWLLSIPLFFLLSNVDYFYTPLIGFINIYLYLIYGFLSLILNMILIIFLIIL